jgi:hypothetical protein
VDNKMKNFLQGNLAKVCLNSEITGSIGAVMIPAVDRIYRFRPGRIMF